MKLDSREEENMAGSPWKRRRDEQKFAQSCIKIPKHSLHQKFDSYISQNMNLDLDIKLAALKVAESVVSVVCIKEGKVIAAGSGTVIKCDFISNLYSATVLTSACILKSFLELDGVKVAVYGSDGDEFEGHIHADDANYNIATLRISSKNQLQCANVKHLNDCLSIIPETMIRVGDKSFGHLRPHSNHTSIRPGDVVLALGRYFDKNTELMAAPGVFSLDCCKFDCKELFKATCRITKCGIGGPLVNLNGEVIGINFYDTTCTPFLPINVVSKCLDHFNEYGEFYRPWNGMQMVNLYAAGLSRLEVIIKAFPDISSGVMVEGVFRGSPADRAGIRCGDAIIQCNGKKVSSLLEFWGMMWDKRGDPLELDVIRKIERRTERLNLTLVVDEMSPDKYNGWPVPEKCMVHARSIR